MKFSARILISASIFVLLFLLVPFSSHAAENLLENPGFEDGTNGWTKCHDTTTFEATSSAAKSGNFSGLVTKEFSKGWTCISQEVEATPSAEYGFSGWVYFNDPKVKYVKLRVDWRDAGGTRVDLSETKLEDKSSEFQKMSLTATAPDGTAKARVEAFVNLEAAGPEDPVLFDDLKLEIVPPLMISFTIPDEVTAGEGFDVPVVIENADPGSEYYAKALVGESTESASLRKGYTYNPALDKWLARNGSWSKMPTFTTNSDASFTLKSKVKDDAASGTYYYLVRIRKVGTNDNLDSDAVALFVNESPDPPDSPDFPGPQINFSVDDTDLKINQPFDVKLDIKNFAPRQDYYVKIRLGLEEGKLSKGRTHNSFYDSWLWDSKSWSDFPIIYTGSDGTWNGTIKAKVSSGNPAGTYIIGVRIRDKEAEKNYDSETQTLIFGEEDPEVAADPPLADGEGAILGAATELPATGGGLLGGGVTSLLVRFWLPVFGWMFLIFIGSSLPGTSVSESRAIDFLAHKAAHLFEYSVLFVLVHRAVKRSFSFVHCSLFSVLSFALTVGYAVTDEIHQMFVCGRDAKFHDIIIDAIAALVGWAVVHRRKNNLAI